MCGIVGKVNLNKRKIEKDDIINMLSVIKHRGPDGNSYYLQENWGFGHTILKIQDLTNLSSQPYKYENYVLTYNGEIYNFNELKKELIDKGYIFETSGDTEVLIKYIHCNGLDKTLEKIEGCYALGLYDAEKEEFYLVRDRFGIKPLYYYYDSDKLIFASEIKSILQDKSIKREFDLEAVAISFNCKLWMDPKKTLFKNIFMIEPGTYIKINREYNVKSIKYYNLEFKDEYKNPEQLIEDFSKEFNKSVKSKLISKVPVAAFLSGGLDSSIVCKILNDNMKEKLSTYTIKYDYDKNIDLNYAEQISKKENFNQHNILINEDMYSIENIDAVTYFVEEILIDKVYIPMYFNYKAAKDDGYTVVVSGQGSDEVWLGYVFTWKIFQYLDKNVNKEILLENYYKNNMLFKNKMNKNFEAIVDIAMNKYLEQNLNLDNRDLLNSYADLSLKTILHDLLLQEDKIAMAHSVESRVPFVDNHHIVELAYKANSKIKLYDGKEKYIVRKFAEGKINDSIIKREKYPFPEPPSIYNEKITKLCCDNWTNIKKSKILTKVIDKEKLESIDNFTPTEQWWLLVYWRFENIFRMEV